MNQPSTEQHPPKTRLPRTVQKQVDAAKAVEADMLANLNTKPGDPPVVAGAPVVGDPPAAPAPTAAPAAPAPVVVGDPPAAPAPTAPVPVADDRDYKRLYEVLRGKYDKEIPELRALLADQAERNRQNETLLSQLADRPAAAPAASSTAAGGLPPPASFTPQEMEEYGPEFFKVVGQRAREIADAEMAPLRKQIEELVGRTASSQRLSAEQARQGVYSTLNDQVPDWETINPSKEFLAWLGGADVFSGKMKRELLTEAFQNNDAARVVGFFKAFQEDSARQPTPAARTASVDPGTLVAPGTSRGGAPAAAPGGNSRVWSQQEIGEFYTLCRKGKISPTDKIRLEREIALAASEGRVR